MECSRCKAINPKDKKFCGDCGAPLDLQLDALRVYLESQTRSQIEATIKEQFKDQRFAEIEITQKVVERLSGWGKLLAYFVGIPLALIFIILSLLGISTYRDFHAQVRAAQDEVATSLQTTKKDIEIATKQVEEVKQKSEELNGQFDQLPRLVQRQDELAGILNALRGEPPILKKLRSEHKAIGIDISHHEGEINWQKDRDLGLSFVVIKATQGTGMTDSRYGINWEESKKAGMIRGAYLYFVGSADPIGQADLFANKVHLEADDLPPVVDVEEDISESSASTSLANLKSCLQALEKRMGRRPIIQVSASLLKRKIINRDFNSYPLWIRQYGVGQPDVPVEWNRWTFWGFTDVALINTGVDGLGLHTFNGTREELLSFVRSQPR